MRLTLLLTAQRWGIGAVAENFLSSAAILYTEWWERQSTSRCTPYHHSWMRDTWYFQFYSPLNIGGSCRQYSPDYLGLLWNSLLSLSRFLSWASLWYFTNGDMLGILEVIKTPELFRRTATKKYDRIINCFPFLSWSQCNVASQKRAHWLKLASILLLSSLSLSMSSGYEGI